MRVQWATMEAQQQKLEAENRALREALEAAAADNKLLRAQLDAALGAASLRAAPAAAVPGKGQTVTPEPAALVLIATLLTVCALTLPTDPVAALLGVAAAASSLLLPSARRSTNANLRTSSAAPGACKAPSHPTQWPIQAPAAASGPSNVPAAAWPGQRRSTRPAFLPWAPARGLCGRSLLLCGGLSAGPRTLRGDIAVLMSASGEARRRLSAQQAPRGGVYHPRLVPMTIE